MVLATTLKTRYIYLIYIYIPNSKGYDWLGNRQFQHLTPQGVNAAVSSLTSARHNLVMGIWWEPHGQEY